MLTQMNYLCKIGLCLLLYSCSSNSEVQENLSNETHSDEIKPSRLDSLNNIEYDLFASDFIYTGKDTIYKKVFNSSDFKVTKIIQTKSSGLMEEEILNYKKGIQTSILDTINSDVEFEFNHSSNTFTTYILNVKQ